MTPLRSALNDWSLHSYQTDFTNSPILLIFITGFICLLLKHAMDFNICSTMILIPHRPTKSIVTYTIKCLNVCDCLIHTLFQYKHIIQNQLFLPRILVFKFMSRSHWLYVYQIHLITVF